MVHLWMARTLYISTMGHNAVLLPDEWTDLQSAILDPTLFDKGSVVATLPRGWSALLFSSRMSNSRVNCSRSQTLPCRHTPPSEDCADEMRNEVSYRRLHEGDDALLPERNYVIALGSGSHRAQSRLVGVPRCLKFNESWMFAEDHVIPPLVLHTGGDHLPVQSFTGDWEPRWVWSDRCRLVVITPSSRSCSYLVGTSEGGMTMDAHIISDIVENISAGDPVTKPFILRSTSGDHYHHEVSGSWWCAQTKAAWVKWVPSPMP